ncbi:aminotransferase [Longispora fulva]|uniref:dTDP-4-amino-4,6-dideoxygalactose transaminase n=1 Tax=Longispora fulva TaxID=619741 RepID=A0A8J7KX03_9ACTN|nr:DegT/DnrJ/EryC1/StrS family aminotransferase [Longispora fulva]MBG6137132.1 dTDP-4-amino-4,6-dideoxygalactose transaminase [Longispora fulva]GIG61514.1 aminotransferase [Longispora fulva]
MNQQVPFTDLNAMTAEIRPAVRAAWDRLLDEGQFIGGRAVEQFERSWAQYCGTSHAVGVANGTDALQLTLMALGVGPGDEVVVPTNTFVATAEAVVLAGARPRFADVSPYTLQLTPETVEAAVTPRTRAVIVVHLYGQTADMDRICRFADGAGLTVVEDAAQAHGATWRGRRAGSIGAAGCFSFYPGKNLGAFGDAGAVVTSDPDLADRLLCLRDHGRATGSHHEHVAVGMNSRLDAVQAVVLSAKLARLDAWNEARRAVAARYAEAFEYGPVRLVEETPGTRGVYHLAVVRVPHRDLVQRRMAALGVQTGVHYPVPCHEQEGMRRYATRPLPVAELAAREVLSLPVFPHMGEEHVLRVCKALAEVLGSGGPDDG